MLDLGLNGRLCVVAGAGGAGIGTAACTMLAQAGAIVLAIDKTDVGCGIAQDALAPFAGRHSVVQADLADSATLDAAIAAAERGLGPVHGLINVVGGVASRDLFAPLLDDDAIDIFERLMYFNTIPTLNASRAVARAMMAHGQGGSIVNIASAAGITAMPFAGGYGASKAALINLTRTMAIEWGKAGIRVNVVSPGSIATQKIGRARFDDGAGVLDEAAKKVVPLGRRGASEDIAGAALFLLSGLATYISGQTLGVDGGMLARPPYNGPDELPVFMADPVLREKLLGV